MFNDPTKLTIDTKTQDRMREWFSKRTQADLVKLTCVQLGDSDVDYERSQMATSMRVLNAPYQVGGIKHKLIYEGNNTGLTGKIQNFVRRVDANGIMNSLYVYPINATYSAGASSPSLANGLNVSSLIVSGAIKQGFVCFFQTLPDGFSDVNGNPLRLKENYSFNLSFNPIGWDFVPDFINGSILIAIPAGYSYIGSSATLTVNGSSSGLSNQILFNY